MAEEVLLEGLLVPTEWSSAGVVRGAGIRTGGGQELRIDADTVTRLLRYLGRTVRVTGRLDRGGGVIRLSTYCIVRPPVEDADR